MYNNKEHVNKTPKVSQLNLLGNEFKPSINDPQSPFNPLSLGMKKVQSQKNQKMMINSSSASEQNNEQKQFPTRNPENDSIVKMVENVQIDGGHEPGKYSII